MLKGYVSFTAWSTAFRYVLTSTALYEGYAAHAECLLTRFIFLA